MLESSDHLQATFLIYRIESLLKIPLYSVHPAGLARNHNTNPPASLRVEALYALPVLLSGVARLILT